LKTGTENENTKTSATSIAVIKAIETRGAGWVRVSRCPSGDMLCYMYYIILGAREANWHTC